MTKRNRITSVILSSVMIFALLFSVLFIIEEAEHKCSDNDCQICTQISISLDLLNHTTPKPVLFSVLAVFLFAVIFSIGFIMQSDNDKTLVELKVKLSN